MKKRTSLLVTLFVMVWSLNLYGGTPLSTNTVKQVVLERLHYSIGDGNPPRDFADVTIRDPEWIQQALESKTKMYSHKGGGLGGGSLPGFLCSARFTDAKGNEVYRVNVLAVWDVVYLGARKIDYDGADGKNPVFCAAVLQKLQAERPEYVALIRKQYGGHISGEEEVRPPDVKEVQSGKRE
jgi:hypothetical protein